MITILQIDREEAANRIADIPTAVSVRSGKLDWHPLVKNCAARRMGNELRPLIANATDENLSDHGRYFSESCTDLTQCYHGDTGSYCHAADGKLVEYLWNNRLAILAMLEQS